MHSERRRKELLRATHSLEYSSPTSALIADIIRREIDYYASYNSQTRKFVTEVRKKLYMLHDYNTQVDKLTYSYPTSIEVNELLVRYVALEYHVLYKSKCSRKYTPEFEDEVQRRVFKTIMYFINGSCHITGTSIMEDRKHIYDEALKIFIHFADDAIDRFPAKTLRNILNTLGMVNVSSVNSGRYLDQNNSSLMRLKEHLRDSDYSSDDDSQPPPVSDNRYGLTRSLSSDFSFAPDTSSSLIHNGSCGVGGVISFPPTLESCPNIHVQSLCTRLQKVQQSLEPSKFQQNLQQKYDMVFNPSKTSSKIIHQASKTTSTSKETKINSNESKIEHDSVKNEILDKRKRNHTISENPVSSPSTSSYPSLMSTQGNTSSIQIYFGKFLNDLNVTLKKYSTDPSVITNTDILTLLKASLGKNMSNTENIGHKDEKILHRAHAVCVPYLDTRVAERPSEKADSNEVVNTISSFEYELQGTSVSNYPPIGEKDGECLIASPSESGVATDIKSEQFKRDIAETSSNVIFSYGSANVHTERTRTSTKSPSDLKNNTTKPEVLLVLIGKSNHKKSTTVFNRQQKITQNTHIDHPPRESLAVKAEAEVRNESVESKHLARLTADFKDESNFTPELSKPSEPTTHSHEKITGTSKRNMQLTSLTNKFAVDTSLLAKEVFKEEMNAASHNLCVDVEYSSNGIIKTRADVSKEQKPENLVKPIVSNKVSARESVQCETKHFIEYESDKIFETDLSEAQKIDNLTMPSENENKATINHFSKSKLSTCVSNEISVESSYCLPADTSVIGDVSTTKVPCEPILETHTQKSDPHVLTFNVNRVENLRPIKTLGYIQQNIMNDETFTVPEKQKVVSKQIYNPVSFSEKSILPAKGDSNYSILGVKKKLKLKNISQKESITCSANSNIQSNHESSAFQAGKSDYLDMHRGNENQETEISSESFKTKLITNLNVNLGGRSNSIEKTTQLPEIATLTHEPKASTVSIDDVDCEKELSLRKGTNTPVATSSIVISDGKAESRNIGTSLSSNRCYRTSFDNVCNIDLPQKIQEDGSDNFNVPSSNNVVGSYIRESISSISNSNSSEIIRQLEKNSNESKQSSVLNFKFKDDKELPLIVSLKNSHQNVINEVTFNTPSIPKKQESVSLSKTDNNPQIPLESLLEKSPRSEDNTLEIAPLYENINAIHSVGVDEEMKFKEVPQKETFFTIDNSSVAVKNESYEIFEPGSDISEPQRYEKADMQSENKNKKMLNHSDESKLCERYSNEISEIVNPMAEKPIICEADVKVDSISKSTLEDKYIPSFETIVPKLYLEHEKNAPTDLSIEREDRMIDDPVDQYSNMKSTTFCENTNVLLNFSTAEVDSNMKSILEVNMDSTLPSGALCLDFLSNDMKAEMTSSKKVQGLETCSYEKENYGTSVIFSKKIDATQKLQADNSEIQIPSIGQVVDNQTIPAEEKHICSIDVTETMSSSCKEIPHLYKKINTINSVVVDEEMKFKEVPQKDTFITIDDSCVAVKNESYGIFESVADISEPQKHEKVDKQSKNLNKKIMDHSDESKLCECYSKAISEIIHPMAEKPIICEEDQKVDSILESTLEDKYIPSFETTNEIVSTTVPKLKDLIHEKNAPTDLSFERKDRMIGDPVDQYLNIKSTTFYENTNVTVKFSFAEVDSNMKSILGVNKDSTLPSDTISSDVLSNDMKAEMATSKKAVDLESCLYEKKNYGTSVIFSKKICATQEIQADNNKNQIPSMDQVVDNETVPSEVKQITLMDVTETMSSSSKEIVPLCEKINTINSFGVEMEFKDVPQKETYITIDNSSVAVKNESYGIFESGADISEAQKNEKMNKESENENKTILNHSDESKLCECYSKVISEIIHPMAEKPIICEGDEKVDLILESTLEDKYIPAFETTNGIVSTAVPKLKDLIHEKNAPTDLSLEREDRMIEDPVDQYLNIKSTSFCENSNVTVKFSTAEVDSNMKSVLEVNTDSTLPSGTLCLDVGMATSKKTSDHETCWYEKENYGTSVIFSKNIDVTQKIQADNSENQIPLMGQVVDNEVVLVEEEHSNSMDVTETMSSSTEIVSENTLETIYNPTTVGNLSSTEVLCDLETNTHNSESHVLKFDINRAAKLRSSKTLEYIHQNIMNDSIGTQRVAEEKKLVTKQNNDSERALQMSSRAISFLSAKEGSSHSILGVTKKSKIKNFSQKERIISAKNSSIPTNHCSDAFEAGKSTYLNAHRVNKNREDEIVSESFNSKLITNLKVNLEGKSNSIKESTQLSKIATHTDELEAIIVSIDDVDYERGSTLRKNMIPPPMATSSNIMSDDKVESRNIGTLLSSNNADVPLKIQDDGSDNFNDTTIMNNVSYFRDPPISSKSDSNSTKIISQLGTNNESSTQTSFLNFEQKKEAELTRIVSSKNIHQNVINEEIFRSPSILKKQDVVSIPKTLIEHHNTQIPLESVLENSPRKEITEHNTSDKASLYEKEYSIYSIRVDEELKLKKVSQKETSIAIDNSSVGVENKAYAIFESGEDIPEPHKHQNVAKQSENENQKLFHHSEESKLSKCYSKGNLSSEAVRPITEEPTICEGDEKVDWITESTLKDKYIPTFEATDEMVSKTVPELKKPVGRTNAPTNLSLKRKDPVIGNPVKQFLDIKDTTYCENRNVEVNVSATEVDNNMKSSLVVNMTPTLSGDILSLDLLSIDLKADIATNKKVLDLDNSGDLQIPLKSQVVDTETVFAEKKHNTSMDITEAMSSSSEIVSENTLELIHNPTVVDDVSSTELSCQVETHIYNSEQLLLNINMNKDANLNPDVKLEYIHRHIMNDVSVEGQLVAKEQETGNQLKLQIASEAVKTVQNESVSIVGDEKKSKSFDVKNTSIICNEDTKISENSKLKNISEKINVVINVSPIELSKDSSPIVEEMNSKEALSLENTDISTNTSDSDIVFQQLPITESWHLDTSSLNSLNTNSCSAFTIQGNSPMNSDELQMLAYLAADREHVKVTQDKTRKSSDGKKERIESTNFHSPQEVSISHDSSILKIKRLGQSNKSDRRYESKLLPCKTEKSKSRGIDSSVHLQDTPRKTESKSMLTLLNKVKKEKSSKEIILSGNINRNCMKQTKQMQRIRKELRKNLRSCNNEVLSRFKTKCGPQSQKTTMSGRCIDSNFDSDDSIPLSLRLKKKETLTCNAVANSVNDKRHFKFKRKYRNKNSIGNQCSIELLKKKKEPKKKVIEGAKWKEKKRKVIKKVINTEKNVNKLSDGEIFHSDSKIYNETRTLHFGKVMSDETNIGIFTMNFPNIHKRKISNEVECLSPLVTSIPVDGMITENSWKKNETELPLKKIDHFLDNKESKMIQKKISSHFLSKTDLSKLKSNPSESNTSQCESSGEISENEISLMLHKSVDILGNTNEECIFRTSYCIPAESEHDKSTLKNPPVTIENPIASEISVYAENNPKSNKGRSDEEYDENDQKLDEADGESEVSLLSESENKISKMNFAKLSMNEEECLKKQTQNFVPCHITKNIEKVEFTDELKPSSNEKECTFRKIDLTRVKEDKNLINEFTEVSEILTQNRDEDKDHSKLGADETLSLTTLCTRTQNIFMEKNSIMETELQVTEGLNKFGESSMNEKNFDVKQPFYETTEIHNHFSLMLGESNMFYESIQKISKEPSMVKTDEDIVNCNSQETCGGSEYIDNVEQSRFLNSGTLEKKDVLPSSSMKNNQHGKNEIGLKADDIKCGKINQRNTEKLEPDKRDNEILQTPMTQSNKCNKQKKKKS